MKKFSFKLEPVLKYKNDRLEMLRNEHAGILRRIRVQEDKIAGLEWERDACAAEFNAKKLSGIIPVEAVNYQNYLTRQNHIIRREYTALEHIRKEEERKRKKYLRQKRNPFPLKS